MKSSPKKGTGYHPDGKCDSNLIEFSIQAIPEHFIFFIVLKAVAFKCSRIYFDVNMIYFITFSVSCLANSHRAILRSD